MRRMILATVLAVSAIAPAAPAASDPAWPSPEWFVREAANFATVSQAPAEQASDPAFMRRWQEQSLANRNEQVQRDANDPHWNSRGNICSSYAMNCTGDPYRYPGVDPFYETEGEVVPVNFYDKQGARLSGRVWAPRGTSAGAGLPGVVIITGSIGAPETLYWWFAQTLVRSGYAVLTFDVRGQGRSDNRTQSGQPGGNTDSSVFVTNLIDAIDFFRSSPDRHYPHNATQAPSGARTTPFNPFWDRIDHGRLGIVGHSLGATGVSVVQGIGAWPGAMDASNPVDVAVAWDNLRGSGSLAGFEVVPRVPIMGQAADYGLAPAPNAAPPDPEGKKAGFNAWRNAGRPAAQIQIKGGAHYEWSLLPGFPTTSWSYGNPVANHYSLAWLDRWLKLPGEEGYGDADARLLADDDWRARFSFYHRTARAFPDRAGTWHRCEDVARGCA